MKLPNVLISIHHRLIPTAFALFLLTSVSYGQRSKNQSKAPVTPTTDAPQVAQDDTTIAIDFNEDMASQLVPFDDLFKLAVAYSPLVKFGTENANSLLATYQLTKLHILQNATGFVNYSTGNQSIITPNAAAEGQTIGQIANGYRAGVGLNLNLYELFGRKQQIRQAQATHQSAVHQRESIELQLRRDLITIYQDMLTAQRILKLQLQDEQVFLTSFRLAEVEYQEGKISADVYAETRGRYTQVKLRSEQARGDFLKNIYQLEAMVGLPIQQLKRK